MTTRRTKKPARAQKTAGRARAPKKSKKTPARATRRGPQPPPPPAAADATMPHVPGPVDMLQDRDPGDEHDGGGPSND